MMDEKYSEGRGGSERSSLFQVADFSVSAPLKKGSKLLA